MLKEIAPHVTRMAIMFNLDTAPLGGAYFVGSFQAAVEPITARRQRRGGETMKVFVLALLLTLSETPLRGETNDEWFKLVTDIDAQRDRLRPAHRKFVNHMVNILSLSEDAKPTPLEAKWLLEIKRRYGLTGPAPTAR